MSTKKNLNLNKKRVSKLNNAQMKEIKGGLAEASPTWSCSNLICGAFSVGKFCDGGTLSVGC